MGRYDDRLVLGNNGNRNCNHLYLGTLNGTIDLGDNNSYNRQEVYLGSGNGNVRVTRVRNDYTIYGDKYIYGPLTQTSNSQHFCDCGRVNNSNVLYCGFRGWVYVNSGITSNQVICQHTVGSTCFWKVLVTPSGQIIYQNRYNNNTIFTAYGQTMSSDTWHYVEVFSQRLYSGGTGSYMYNRIDSGNWTCMKSSSSGGSDQSCGGRYYQWNGLLQLASTPVALKGTIEVWGANGNTTYHNSFNVQDRPADSAFGSLNIGNVTINGSRIVTQYIYTGTEWI